MPQLQVQKFLQRLRRTVLTCLPALLGKDDGEPIREYTLHQTISLALAIRKSGTGSISITRVLEVITILEVASGV